MQKIRIRYNPYKMKTEISVNGTDICKIPDYLKFSEFIETNTPLQIWAEPIPYKNWNGIINELAGDQGCYDEIEIIFDGRKIDYIDLKNACEFANKKRKTQLKITYELAHEYSDAKLIQNIKMVKEILLGERISRIVDEWGENSLISKEYKNLPKEYEQAENREFKIVFAGLYSSGKSTILNALIHHNILPTSDETCTSKTCRLKHDKYLKGKITLECFDEDKKIVVPKEIFDNDEACLNRLWEISPLGENKSNPENVETIELCLDLSHLYPSKEMEKEFNLVIVDTPGCNSSKTKGADADIKQDIKIALEAINNGQKEMVVICADAQDYEDESLGIFLKAINETVQDKDDKGDFNDRFLFVLNKCDVLKYNEKESVIAKKDNFARYLMDTKRWGIEEKEDAPKFTPKIFMVCAYIKLAIQMGVAHYTKEELRLDKQKKNLSQEYKKFVDNIIDFEDDNYFLYKACDVSDHLRNELQRRFESSIDENERDAAIEIQTGMECVENSIKDYIARYAYPFKVRDLMDTFDILLQFLSVTTEHEDEQLKKRIEDVGKGISEREEVEKEKRDQEKIKEKLALLEKKVEEQKQAIQAIHFSSNTFTKIRENMEFAFESEEVVDKIRRNNNKFSKDDIQTLIASIDKIFKSVWSKSENQFQKLTSEYKLKLEEICDRLKAIAEELKNGKDYDFNGYRFVNSIGVEKINRMDVNALRKEVEATKETVEERRLVEKLNPIKNEEYKWWQFGKRLTRFFAPDTIYEYEKEKADVYNANPLTKYLTNISAEFRDLCEETAENYSNDIKKMKEQALRMANDIPEDIKVTTKRISEFTKKINFYGNNITKLEQEMKEIKEKKKILRGLIGAIQVEGGQDE